MKAKTNTNLRSANKNRALPNAALAAHKASIVKAAKAIKAANAQMSKALGAAYNTIITAAKQAAIAADRAFDFYALASARTTHEKKKVSDLLAKKSDSLMDAEFAFADACEAQYAADEAAYEADLAIRKAFDKLAK